MRAASQEGGSAPGTVRPSTVPGCRPWALERSSRGGTPKSILGFPCKLLSHNLDWWAAAP
ncbi:hypothetical protein GZL_04581 [Streptomyces sp. 769]|nr:hypothetical protein GZL_04581 [Streptomyces sp. 769]